MADINQAMVRIYVNLITNGRRTLETIPEVYRQAVQDALTQHG